MTWSLTGSGYADFAIAMSLKLIATLRTLTRTSYLPAIGIDSLNSCKPSKPFLEAKRKTVCKDISKNFLIVVGCCLWGGTSEDYG